MALIPCLNCGRLSRLTRKGRCSHCSKTTQRGYGWEHQQRARAAIAAQPWCSECGSTVDLTAGHVVPVHRGVASPLRVLCRPCNSGRGDEVTFDSWLGVA